MAYTLEQGMPSGEAFPSMAFEKTLGEMGVLGKSKENFLSNDQKEKSEAHIHLEYGLVTGQIPEDKMEDEERSFRNDLERGILKTGMSDLSAGDVGRIDTLDKYAQVISEQVAGNAIAFRKLKAENPQSPQLKELQKVTAEMLYSLEQMGLTALDDNNSEFAEKALGMTGYLSEHPEIKRSIDQNKEVHE